MDIPLIYRCDPWLVAVVLTIALIGVEEIGYRVARQYGRHHENPSQLETIQGAVFALLALLLAFTFAAAASRYDVRRGQVVEVANAIGTAYLRAQTLPEPYRTPASTLLRDYADVQLAYAHAHSARDLQSLARAASQLQTQLWSVTAEAAIANPDSVIVGLYVAAVNEVIDGQTRRLAAIYNRVPNYIWMILIVITLFAFFIIGYRSGLGRTRNFLIISIVAVIIALVIVMIIDFDRPTVGAIRVSPQPLLDLRSGMR